MADLTKKEAKERAERAGRKVKDWALDTADKLRIEAKTALGADAKAGLDLLGTFIHSPRVRATNATEAPAPAAAAGKGGK